MAKKKKVRPATLTLEPPFPMDCFNCKRQCLGSWKETRTNTGVIRKWYRCVDCKAEWSINTVREQPGKFVRMTETLPKEYDDVLANPGETP